MAVNELDMQYYTTFSHGHSGSAVLDNLIATFHVPSTFDPTNERLSCFRQGQKDVIDYILTRMQQAERQPTTQ